MNTRRWLALGGVGLLVAFVVATLVLWRLEPRLKADIERTLAARLDSQVTLDGLELALWPAPRLAGRGLVVRHRGRTDIPPLVSIQSFAGRASWIGLWNRRLADVVVDGLEFTIPPQRRAGMPSLGTSDDGNGPSVTIDILRTTNARLTVMPRDEGKAPRVFDIFSLSMRDLTFVEPSPFEAELTNPVPAGRIHASGQFGPWGRSEPADTPLEGRFTFAADLGTVKGVAGRLDADGAFSGLIGRVVATGATRTPDFRIPRLKAAALPLETTFRAVVDGTNGDVQLESVDVRLGDSAFRASGFIVGTRGIRGKRVLLDVTAGKARMEDVLRLAVRTTPPAMTGALTMTSTFDLPRGDGDVLDRLILAGTVTISGARFSSDEVQDKVDDLSRRGRGRPKDEDIDDVPSNIGARFVLKDGVVTLREIAYRVRGATVALGGSYALESGRLDFAGTARLRASVSQTQTGIRHFLLKPFDPLFRKGGAATRLAIRVTGTVDDPKFEIDLGRTLKGR